MTEKTFLVVRKNDNVCSNVVVLDNENSERYYFDDTFYLLEKKDSYNKGTGMVSVTNGSKNITISTATFVTDGIEIGRTIFIADSEVTGRNCYIHKIASIISETEIELDSNYEGSTTNTNFYGIESFKIGDVVA